MVKKNSYTDFLKDRDFIRWQLMPDESLNRHWANFRREHPESEEELRKAIAYLKKDGLNKCRLREDERSFLLENITTASRMAMRRKRSRALLYTTASVAATLLILIGFRLLFPISDTIEKNGEDTIVGELLNNEDIQLITKEKTISFRDDIEMTLHKEGTAEIHEKDKGSSKVKITQDKTNTLIIPYGKRSTLTLADGSKVWLNSGSILEFPTQFNAKKREIHLTSGEVYVEVAHDVQRPFLVHTDGLEIKVYGTKFNVSNYSETAQSVVLVEGKVGLVFSDKKEIFLQPNQQAIYSTNDIVETLQVEATHFTSWKDGYLTFDKTPITEVLNQIGRYYNLSFNFENDVNLQKRTCTGKIYLSENMDNVMTIIGLLSSTTFTRTEDKILITNKPS